MFQINFIKELAACGYRISQISKKTGQDPEFTKRYRHIKSRRGHKKAIIAICHRYLAHTHRFKAIYTGRFS